jgi:hypothetical protein
MWQYHPMVLSSTSELPKTRDARSPWWCQATTTSHVGLLLIAKSKDNNIPVYDNHLFLPPIVLSDAIKKYVVLLTTTVSKNIIQ